MDMRGKQAGPDAPRGATPQLTIAKHQLRDWVESRLSELPRDGDGRELGRKLNLELRNAKLLCRWDDKDQQSCPEWIQLGYLSELTLSRSSAFLILQTGVGIECGFDESAYLYSWSDEGWRRVWQNEQNTYTKEAYKPQTIHAALISPYSKSNDYIVLTLGSEPWCSSNWHDVYYRAFRLGPDWQARPLVEGSEWAYLAHDPPIRGNVTRDEILVEFTPRSIDGGLHNREAIQHYRIEAGGAKRIDPLALSPRDFVDEWLTQDWREAAFWSESAHRPDMRDRHEKRNSKDLVFGQFHDPTMHCARPDLWQVGADFGEPPKAVYFLVRWWPPYRFSMVEVSDQPSADCTTRDPYADERRTLFPGW